MAGRALTLDITTRDQQTLAALKRVQKELRDTGSAAGAAAAQGGRLGNAFAGLAIGAGVKFALDEFEEAEVSARQTAAAIEATGNAARVSAGEQDKLVESLSRMAGVDDEIVNGGANILRTFTSIKDERFGEALAASMDIAAAKGKDLDAVATQLGKALQSPATASKVLRGLGIELTEQQREQIKVMAEAGDVAGAQALILEEVGERYEGQAEAAATSSGKIKVAFGNAAESAGEVLAPALETAATAIGVVSDAFSALPGPVQGVVLAGATGAVVWSRWGEQLAGAGGKALELAKNVAVPSRALDGLGGSADSAASAAASTGRSMAGAAVGAAALAGAVAAGAIAYRQWNEEGERAAEGWLDDLGAKNGFTVEGLQRTADKLREANGLLKETGGWIAGMPDLGDVLDWDANTAIRSAKEQAEADAAAAEAAIQKINMAAQSLGVSVSEAETLIASADIDPTVATLFELVAAMSASKTEADQLAAAEEELGVEVKSTAEKIDEAAAAAERAEEALRAYYEVVSGSLTTEIDYRNALADVTTALAENGAEVGLNTQKGRDNLTAVQDAAQAALDLAIAKAQETGNYRDGITAMTGYVDELRSSMLQAGLTQEQVDYLIATMKLTPADIETQFTAHSNYAQVSDDLDWAARARTALITGRITIGEFAQETLLSGLPLFGSRAGGGPVQRGRSYVVGEQRPEVFTAPADGMIVPSVGQHLADQAHEARDARRRQRAAGGGNTVSLAITVPPSPTPEATAQAVAREVGWQLALMGVA